MISRSRVLGSAILPQERYLARTVERDALAIGSDHQFNAVLGLSYFTQAAMVDLLTSPWHESGFLNDPSGPLIARNGEERQAPPMSPPLLPQHQYPPTPP